RSKSATSATTTGRSGSRDGRQDKTEHRHRVSVPSVESAVARTIGRTARRTSTDRELDHEEFLAACLEREVAARQDHGGEGRIRAARFPARKTLEDFAFSFQRSPQA